MHRHAIEMTPPSTAAYHRHQLGSAVPSGIVLLLVTALLLSARSADGQMAGPLKESHWVPATLFPAGAMLSIVSGDPSLPGQTVAELLLPDGYRVPPHFHPMGERLEVVEGALLVGSGDQVDVHNTAVLSPGDTDFAEAGMHHYWVARGRTVVALTFEGPFIITYVHANEAPRRATFPFQY